MEEDLQNTLLNSFPNSEFNEVLFQFDPGNSGSPVFAVHYKKKNKYGLDGTFIVKIGTIEWALEEQRFYDSLPEGDKRSSLLTQGHMHTHPLEGLDAVKRMAAVAYEVAFGAIIQPKTLMNVLDEGRKSEQEAQKQIKELMQALVNWYSSGGEPRADYSLTLLRHMLTERRAESLLPKLNKFLPSWRADVPHIVIDASGRRLPNPLAYEEICRKIRIKLPYSVCRIHGDLHTGNVIFSPKAGQIPKLIDFEYSTPDGVSFFDLAYLEFDIIRHMLPVDELKNREEWLALLNESMSEIQMREGISSWGAARTSRFLAPIRDAVWQLRQLGEETNELVWWLATVATGLNFARKGDHTRSPFERMAGLLYAAYGLDRILKMCDMKDLSTKESVPVVPWIQGITDAPNLSEPSSVPSTQEELTVSLAEQMAQSVAEISAVDNRAAQEPQFLLTGEDQEPVIGQSESDALSSLVGVALPTPDLAEEKKSGEEKHAESSSVIEVGSIQQLLQEAVDLFQKGGNIYKDRCTSTAQTLQSLETYLPELRPKISEGDFNQVFSYNNLLDLQKSILKDLQKFREGCPPAPARKLTQVDYDKECAIISDKLEKLQAKFLEFLKLLP